ncbi:hypothetical protein A2678_00940 [Candidatus Kaiserbacteria bacterium RIFCSPHIGHO2_01_FULL_53_31]|uniref:Bacterial Ig domain-containing protein n=1 Tax=Candidatus Kaiserbacteria bacterium RIFCSPHIGHO2_01_FULL_53_31 TaxID=1798481 RepID=A0A1F6CJA2_9BACT|nr:MAG: hypothetical protein A2678_00940 [Candidatus Kaiserbacteria bacterium RIFCSPHIGHO2_01_FULL_53_31]
MTRRLLVILLISLAAYGLIEAWPLIKGPALVINEPTNDATFENGIVTVRGTVARAALFTLDGAAVLRDQNGNFSSTLTFPRGGSILTFIAVDRFGRTVTATRSIFVPTANDQPQTNN